MSNTIAHRPQVHHHVPLMPVFAVIVTIALATVVIWAVNQPQTTITTSGGAVATTPIVQPQAPPVPDSPVFRHAEIRALQSGGHSQAYLTGRLHQVEGTTLDPLTTAPITGYGRSEFGGFSSSR
jgi:hypothetical protein